MQRAVCPHVIKWQDIVKRIVRKVVRNLYIENSPMYEIWKKWMICYVMLWCDIIRYHITSYHIISYHITSYHIISHHIISHHIIWYRIVSYHILFYSIISHHIIFYHVIRCFMKYSWVSYIYLKIEQNKRHSDSRAETTNHIIII